MNPSLVRDKERTVETANPGPEFEVCLMDRGAPSRLESPRGQIHGKSCRTAGSGAKTRAVGPVAGYRPDAARFEVETVCEWTVSRTRRDKLLPLAELNSENIL